MSLITLLEQKGGGVRLWEVRVDTLAVEGDLVDGPGLGVVVEIGPEDSEGSQVGLDPLREVRIDTWAVKGDLVDGPGLGVVVEFGPGDSEGGQVGLDLLREVRVDTWVVDGPVIGEYVSEVDIVKSCHVTCVSYL